MHRRPPEPTLEGVTVTQLADPLLAIPTAPAVVDAGWDVPHLVTEVPGPLTRAQVERDERVTSPSLPRAYPFAPVRGRGCVVEDLDGNRFLDFAAGIAVNSTGHAHPRVVAAIQDQAADLLHYSASDFYLPIYVETCERLAQLAPFSGPARVYLGNSGAEVVEGAIKLARYATGRQHVVSFLGAFHGRTYGALSATGQPGLKEGFGPMLEGFVHVEPCNADAVAAVVTDRTAAVIVEPIIGEGGAILPPDGYLRALRDICDRSGAKLILDEVQTGNGRTGTLFAYEHEGIVPDIVTTAKGLGAGLPIGAVLAREDVAAAFVPGSHGTTFGANPVCCAAALAVMDELTSGGVTENAARVGAYFLGRLEESLAGRDDVVAVRGKGLLLGVEFKTDTKPLVKALLERGVVANSTAGTVLRIIPPLILTEAEVDEAIAAILEVLP